MSGMWEQAPISIQWNTTTPRGLRIVLTAVLAMILILVGTGWFVDHVQTNQIAHHTLETLRATRQELAQLRMSHSTVEFELTSVQMAYDKLDRQKLRLETLQVQYEKQELSHQQQIVKEHEEQGMARAEALLAARMQGASNAARIQLEAQHEELQKQHASLKIL